MGFKACLNGRLEWAIRVESEAKASGNLQGLRLAQAFIEIWDILKLSRFGHLTRLRGKFMGKEFVEKI